jgi:CRISPR type IV-associated protein Csf3
MPSRKAHTPLRVRAWLRSGVVADRFLPLDGILFYQAQRDRYGPADVSLPGTYTGVEETILPLSIARQGRPDWYYQCSWAQWPEHTVEGADHWNKRFDQSLAQYVDFQGKRGRILVGEGRYKAYRMPVFYRAALWVDWYCQGNQAGIEALLRCVTHIGKKGAQGWGRVIRWEVEPAPEDYSVWRGKTLMRGVPADEAPGREVLRYGIRPSYWNPDNQWLLALP